ncbi:MAG: glycerol-3-phosphate dehydrogenase/oxidase [Chitinophagales bacterium]|nr:glycerol-3-phosphate dehydrogenase/oxidase [Chitinophagales bacterium]MCZ2394642.1 glycerol-3-phosphate dehydrogenase/oxidase [Chitinophagales bacterium]
MDTDTLNSFGRNQLIETMSSQEFDILVVGGGITGAGIALDAATRGLKVALIEKGDFAEGTSSRSTKLIHGGLRYLKQMEFGIVRETGQERTILFHNAPHIVYPERMLLPIIKGGSLGKYSTSFGLYVYDRLAGVEKKERRFMLNKSKTLEQEPLLRDDILLGGGIYIEYRSDDARLTIEVLKTAAKKGASIINYVQANQLIYDNEIVKGALVSDLRTGLTFQIKAKKVINASGPWVDNLRKSDNSLKGKRLHLTKGVHIVVPKERLPIRQAVYFDVPTDGRMVFAIPRQDIVYIGTTDTNYKGNLEQCFADISDVEYILKAANYIFPHVHLQVSDVKSSWSGLRPLIHEDGKSPSDLSRKDEVFISESGLISIAGGKLTGFRKMAERAVDVALKQLMREEGRSYISCTTDNIVLSGGDISGEKSIVDFEEKLADTYSYFDSKSVKSLARKYGSNAVEILNNAALKYSKNTNALLLAEIDYSIQHEMCQTVSDFIVRRTGRLYFERPSLKNIYPLVHEHIQTVLGVNSSNAEKDISVFENEYYSVIAFAE